ncbi:amidohydrolase family protein [bacterium]|nr:amidohydrolase family protein [bacterium]
MDIPVEQYFDQALAFSDEEVKLALDLMAWLPDTIIDAHAHCNAEEHLENLPAAILQHMMSTFPWHDLQHSAQMKARFFPGKRVMSLRFAHASKGIDHRAANAYLISQSPPGDRVALYGIPDDAAYTIAQLNSMRFAALKMYYMYWIPPATRIYEYFPPEVLEVTQELGIPIILHLPKMITVCFEQLAQLVRDFPEQRIVLAHLGLPHLPVPGLLEAYRAAAQYEHVHMDTAMIPSSEVVSMALQAFGSARIMYGSDEPLNLVRAVAYTHPVKGQRLAARGYHWVDPDEERDFGYLADEATHMHWQAIGALREGIAATYASPTDQESIKNKVFYENARELYKFI